MYGRLSWRVFARGTKKRTPKVVEEITLPQFERQNKASTGMGVWAWQQRAAANRKRTGRASRDRLPSLIQMPLLLLLLPAPATAY